MFFNDRLFDLRLTMTGSFLFSLLIVLLDVPALIKVTCTFLFSRSLVILRVVLTCFFQDRFASPHVKGISLIQSVK